VDFDLWELVYPPRRRSYGGRGAGLPASNLSGMVGVLSSVPRSHEAESGGGGTDAGHQVDHHSVPRSEMDGRLFDG
jgi:hypothetical protein